MATYGHMPPPYLENSRKRARQDDESVRPAGWPVLPQHPDCQEHHMPGRYHEMPEGFALVASESPIIQAQYKVAVSPSQQMMAMVDLLDNATVRYLLACAGTHEPTGQTYSNVLNAYSAARERLTQANFQVFENQHGSQVNTTQQASQQQQTFSSGNQVDLQQYETQATAPDHVPQQVRPTEQFPEGYHPVLPGSSTTKRERQQYNHGPGQNASKRPVREPDQGSTNGDGSQAPMSKQPAKRVPLQNYPTPPQSRVFTRVQEATRGPSSAFTTQPTHGTLEIPAQHEATSPSSLPSMQLQQDVRNSILRSSTESTHHPARAEVTKQSSTQPHPAKTGPPQVSHKVQGKVSAQAGPSTQPSRPRPMDVFLPPKSSKIIDFDKCSKDAWYILNKSSYAKCRSSQQFHHVGDAYFDVSDIISSIRDRFFDEGDACSYGTKLSALEILRKISKTILLTNDCLGQGVRQKFGSDTSVPDIMLDVLRTMTPDECVRAGKHELDEKGPLLDKMQWVESTAKGLCIQGFDGMQKVIEILEGAPGSGDDATELDVTMTTEADNGEEEEEEEEGSVYEDSML